MEGDLDQVVQDALRACFQRVADRSKGKVSPEDAARMFHKKSGEMLAELSRGPVNWVSAPYSNVRELYRAGSADRVVKVQVTVEQFAVPTPITVSLGDHDEERVVTEVRVVDSRRSAITSLPVSDADHVARLDELRVEGRRFEVLGAVTDVQVDPVGRREFRLLVLDVRPITTSLQMLRASPHEETEARDLLARLRQEGLSPFEYIRHQVCRHLGIIELPKEARFSRAVDTAIIATFSCGVVNGTPGNLHHLVVGPSGVGKKLLAQIARTLQPTYAEIGVTKVTDAGLCGAARRKDGVWTHTPGLLPRSHGGAFVAEDVHELAPHVRRSLVGMLLKLMEDGRLLDSTVAASEYDVHTSVHFDQNLRADVWDGEGDPRYTFQSLQLPKHFIGRTDFITALPRDNQRQRRLACEIAGAPERSHSPDAAWARELQVLVALSRDEFSDPSLKSVTSLMNLAMEALCTANAPKQGAPLVHFDDFLTRLAVSLRKTAKAVCRSRCLVAATQDEVEEAKRLLRAKVEFLARLEPGVVSPSSWSTKAARQQGIQNEFGGQEVSVDDLKERAAEKGAHVDPKTIRRDLKDLGGKRVARGLFLLPERN